jgi:hypothetical protein
MPFEKLFCRLVSIILLYSIRSNILTSHINTGTFLLSDLTEFWRAHPHAHGTTCKS